jgi:hypothetical protein
MQQRRLGVILTTALFAGACTGPVEQTQPWTYARHYVAGEVFGYELATTHLYDGLFDRCEVGTSSHEVLADATGESVSWVGLTVEDATGAIADLTDEALAVPTYEMSLLADADMAMPDLVVPDMVGMITDLFTYYVAVSSALGVQELHEPGDQVTADALAHGDWSDGAGTPVGDDCILATVELLALDPQGTASFETRFEVPDDPDCFEWEVDAWSEPIAWGVSNNFQQVTDQEGDLVAMYGVEWFTIRSEMDAVDGRILSATMDNQLDLRLLAGCDESWQDCAYEGDLHLQRQEELAIVVD